MNKLTFSSQEIASIICDLGLPENAFGNKISERMDIINCWDSCDIVACPGSGKTTVLLAKLLLLARRMPFEDGRGICVLTHTNVAIDKIKHQLNSKVDVLFKYPNYFGTIQSFVNRFLSIPCFKELYKCNVKAIDGSLYAQKVNKVSYWKLGNNAYSQDFYNNKGEIQRYLKANDNIHNELQYCINKDDRTTYLSRKINGPKLEINKPASKTNYDNNTKDVIYSYLNSVKKTMHKSLHTLNYSDAFYFADAYLHKHAYLSDVFCQRFKYVFVDEMQDTQSHQLDLIERLFQQSGVQQYYGDLDQSIFDGISGGKTAWKPGTTYKTLQITNTKRFGKLIANVATPFCREIDKINPDKNRQSLKPHLILFDDPKDVLPKFASIIKKYNLDKEAWGKTTIPFNAVGFVSKEAEKKPNRKNNKGVKKKLTLKSYFEGFNRNTQNKKFHFKTLISYFQKQPDNMINKIGSRVYYEFFMSGLVQLLDAGSSKHPNTKRYYTVSTFRAFLMEKDETVYYGLHKLFAELIVDLKKEGKDPKDIKKKLINYFKNNIDSKIIKDFKSLAYTADFVKSENIDKADTVSASDNIYKSEDNIEIKIGTVHSVKSETHSATLLLETENYNKSESTYFHDQFCGHKTNAILPQKLNHLRVDYVALTRPSNLICVALQKDKMRCTACGKQNECEWEI